ncbi:MAG TPA: isoprenylcysteine carboxylmethyltransferase family protein [Blastocatellia bacterium]|nr:isoprenylcysteine carboxylmethyltransferase family protein [Blastocatellia bacterium]
MSAVALGIYAAFMVSAFGLRVWVQYRRTGDFGLRVRSDGAGSLGGFNGALLLFGVVLAGAAPVAELLELTKPPAVADTPLLRGTGLALALFGIVVTVVSQYQMGDSWRVGVDKGEETTLITVGLFRVMRNPIFTGMLLATAGLVMMVPNLLSAAALTSLFVGLEVQVRRIEEPYLARVHGSRYLSYARVVGRFVPWVGRLQ